MSRQRYTAHTRFYSTECNDCDYDNDYDIQTVFIRDGITVRYEAIQLVQ